MSAIRTGVAALLSLMLGNAVQAQEHMVFLLRHAEKASEPPADPPLSAAGEQRASILAIRLANANPAAIFTSQYQRTQLTAKPLAEAVGIGITVVPIDKANAGEYPQQLRERVCAMPANSNTVIIGHSNTIPAVAALGCVMATRARRCSRRRRSSSLKGRFRQRASPMAMTSFWPLRERCRAQRSI